MRLTERESRESGREYALRILKENIISLDLEPGSRLSENELAAELRLSRTQVREALIELAKGKIVEVYPQRGSVVSLMEKHLSRYQFDEVSLREKYPLYFKMISDCNKKK